MPNTAVLAAALTITLRAPSRCGWRAMTGLSSLALPGTAMACRLSLSRSPRMAPVE